MTSAPAARRAAGRAGRGGRGPQVEPAPRAIAIRSPRTARGGRGAARAGAVEADRADRLGVDLDPVPDAGRAAQRRVERERRRQDRGGEAAVGLGGSPWRGGGSTAGRRARPRRHGPVTAVMPGPAGPPRPSGRVAIDGGIEPAVEREPGEDHQLVDRVEPLDVARRVRLGVAEPLGLGERVVVVARRLGRSSRSG